MRESRAVVGTFSLQARSSTHVVLPVNVKVRLIDITRFGEDGLAHEHGGVFDALGMMQQLGAIDAPALGRPDPPAPGVPPS